MADVTLYVEEAGMGAAVVLIHGFSLDTRMWDPQFDVLARHFRTIRYDMRGFGQSPAPDGI
ncbi:MAG: alpha/beta fold hydrolase, partial [Caldilineaceae bacterium]|nr:alpha/beta fold hydrolase [Caldilineaceae bacterium]